MFAKCIYPPACLGAPNPALESQYYDENQDDLATSGRSNNSSNTNASNCATHLAFRSQSRLCHACNATSKRKGIARCDVCPDSAQTIVLMVLGFFIAVGIVVFLVVSAIKDAGKVLVSDSIQKILINYLQVIAFAQKFPLRWPQFLEDLFEFQGAISTIGEHLLNPDCLSTTRSAAELFYSKQVTYAFAPFIASVVAFVFWYLKGCCSGKGFFSKRSDPQNTTTKDKCILTIGTVVYFMFPTLCTNAFSIFHCRAVAGNLFLAADMEEPCYVGRHLQHMLLLGLSQLLTYVIGLPVLVLVFLRRNKHLDGGGLQNHATIVRYGLFYGAYKENTYYWEIVLTARKIMIVALSVFGPGLGTERQAQMVLAVLLVCISLEIAGDPFKLINDRFRVLGRLEIATLFVQWATMWGGSMIFASQDPESRSFVVFLTVVVATINVGMLVWLLVQMVKEYVHEQQEEAAKNGDEHGGSLRNMVSNVRDSLRRWRFSRMTPEQQQRSIRERTVDAIDGMTAENPAVTIEMADIYQSASSVGEVKLDEEVVHEISFMENPMEVEKKGLA